LKIISGIFQFFLVLVCLNSRVIFRAKPGAYSLKIIGFLNLVLKIYKINQTILFSLLLNVCIKKKI